MAERSVAAASALASASIREFPGARAVDAHDLRVLALQQLADELGRLLLGGRPAVGREHEAVLRPGHGHVQQAALLLGVDLLALDSLAQQLLREGAAGALAGGPLVGEQLRDEDVPELQPLGLVEGHEPDALHVLGQLHAGRQLAAGGLVGVEVVDEPAQVPVRVLRLPVRGEAEEARDVGHDPMRIGRADGDHVEHLAGQLQVALEDGERALPPGLRLELLDHVEQPAQLRAQGGLGAGVCACLRGGHDLLDHVDQVGLVEPRGAADVEDLERVQAPRAGGHHPGQRHVVVRIRDGAQALLQVPDLRRGEQREAAHHRVRDVLLLQPGDDRLAVLVLPIQDRHLRPGRARVVVRLHGVHDGHRLVLRPATDDDLHLAAVLAAGPQPLVRLEAGGVVHDQPVGGGQHLADRAEVLLDAQDGRLAGRRAVGRVGGWPAEAPVELGEGGKAGAAESVDGLVVVAHHHHVVRPVRRASQQLDQLDLRDVRVLEFVHQQVAELALPAAQDVGARLEELRHRRDLLAEVERTPPVELLLVRAIDLMRSRSSASPPARRRRRRRCPPAHRSGSAAPA